MTVALVAAGALLARTGEATARQEQPRLDRERLLLVREAFNLVSRVGNEVWPGWSSIPLTTLVVAEDHEFLVFPPEDWEPSSGFQESDQTFLGRPLHWRNRTLPMALRAAFPVDGTPAAVVGAWRPQEESPNEWVVTLVHEWFHVLQMQREEEAKIEDLGLGEGSYPSLQLDYPFAYGDRDIANAIHLLGKSLYDFWERSRTLPRVMQRTFVAETPWAALENLQTVVSLKYGEDAYSYFQYQTWKEGVARYTQVQVSMLAAEREKRGRLRPVPGFASLMGAMPYDRLWEEVTATTYWEIRATSVGAASNDPTSFYGIGHGMAELLDAINPDWKERYFDEEVWLDDLVAEIMEASLGDAR